MGLKLPKYFAWPTETAIIVKAGRENPGAKFLDENPFELPLPDFGNIFVEEPGECPTTVLEVLEGYPEASIFTAALRADIADPKVHRLVTDPFAVSTVFVPNNDAMMRFASAVNASGGQSMRISREALLEVVPSHIIENEALTVSDMFNGRVLTTTLRDGTEEVVVLGEGAGEAGVVAAGNFALDTGVLRSTATQTDIKACDSIIHIVDSVLVPASAFFADYVGDYFEDYAVATTAVAGGGGFFTDVGK